VQSPIIPGIRVLVLCVLPYHRHVLYVLFSGQVRKNPRFPDFLRLHRSKTRIFGFPEHLVIRVLLLVHICSILRSRPFLVFVLCLILILSLSLLVYLILTHAQIYPNIFLFLALTPY